eukprot:gene3950-biopygen12319
MPWNHEAETRLKGSSLQPDSRDIPLKGSSREIPYPNSKIKSTPNTPLYPEIVSNVYMSQAYHDIRASWLHPPRTIDPMSHSDDDALEHAVCIPILVQNVHGILQILLEVLKVHVTREDNNFCFRQHFRSTGDYPKE